MINPFESINLRLTSIEKLILDLNHNSTDSQNSEQIDKLLTIEEAANFLSLSKATLYAKVSKGVIPFSKPQGTKRLYFSENELREYLKTGRKKTNQEIEEEAEEYLKKERRSASC